MNDKHTPGPWHSLDRNPSSGLVIRGGSHHYPIAKVSSYWDGPGPRSDEALANCDLIAASSELLQLAKANLATMQEHVRRCEKWSKSHAELDKAIEETEAVITKATGGPA